MDERYRFKAAIFISGEDPDEEVGREPVRLGDLAEALELLGSGRRSHHVIFQRYAEVARESRRDPGTSRTVGKVLSALGCPPVQVPIAGGYARGRLVNLVVLRKDWPHLFPSPSSAS